MLEEPALSVEPEERPRPDGPGWGWRDVGATVALAVAATLALSLVVQGAASALGFEAGAGLVSPALYLMGLGIYLAVVAGVYLFAARRAGWAALGLRRAGWGSFAIVPPLFVLEVITLLLVNGAVGALAGGFENPQVDAITGGRAVSLGELAMLLVLIAGVVPFVEELFFRGMLYPLLRGRMGAAAAVALNAAIFSLTHVFPLLLPGLFVVGLFLAFLRERSGSIWPSVCLHALQNGLALISIAAVLGGGL